MVHCYTDEDNNLFLKDCINRKVYFVYAYGDIVETWSGRDCNEMESFNSLFHEDDIVYIYESIDEAATDEDIDSFTDQMMYESTNLNAEDFFEEYCTLLGSITIPDLVGFTTDEAVNDNNGSAVWTINNKLVESLKINNKEIQSIIATDGTVLYAKKQLTPTLITITQSPATIRTIEGGTVTILLTDNDNNPLANKNIIYTFNNTTSTLTTNNNGEATIQVNISTKGTYPLVVDFEGDEDYEASNETYDVLISIQSTKLTVPTSTVSYSLNATKYVEATLTCLNAPLANKAVTFQVNGVTYSATTNANGLAKRTVTLTAKKTYTVLVSFSADNTYGTAMATYKLKVN